MEKVFLTDTPTVSLKLTGGNYLLLFGKFFIYFQQFCGNLQACNPQISPTDKKDTKKYIPRALEARNRGGPCIVAVLISEGKIERVSRKTAFLQTIYID